MSKLSKEDVLKLARLSRLVLTDEELAQFAEEISGVLDYVEQLQKLSLEDYEPTYQVTGLTNVTRTDTLKKYDATRDKLLKNVPAIEKEQIKTKRILT
jgi:aspartyl-tRNA(Asn)/glutamyl-tRNA(Gln) amidotransferase subunit C